METVDPKARIGDFIESRILKFELLILAIIVFILILVSAGALYFEI